MRILVTRPAYAAQTLCEQITALGAIAESFPVIDILPTPHQAALETAIKQLNTQDIAVFTSRPAADFAMKAINEAIKAKWTNWNNLSSILWAAIGPGTAKVLQKHGLPSVYLPPKAPFETETLLATQPFLSVNAKKITIFRGNGGRDLLNKVLKQRGAVVQMVETYQRGLPTINMVEKRALWRHNPIHMIVTTSPESLHNLFILMGNDIPHGFKDIPLVVVGSRMLALAQKLGFKRPLLSMGADDASIIKVLQDFKENRA